MNKFGFDYFVKKAEVLNEARTSPWMAKGDAGPAIKNIFDGVVGVMKRGGELGDEFVPGLGGNRPVNRALRYIIFLLSGIDEMDDSDEVSDEEANGEIVTAATNILGIPKNEWKKHFKDADKLYRATIMRLIETQPQKILSPEFRQKATDRNNILSYVASNRFTNAFSHAAAGKREAVHGIPAIDIDAAQTRIRDILTKIHRAQFYKRRKKNPKLMQREQDAGNEFSNGFIDNAYVITDALDVLMDNSKFIKQTINSRLSKFPNPTQETLDDMLVDLADEHPNLSLDYIRTLYRANPQRLQSLFDEYSQLHESGVDMEEFERNIEQLKANNSDAVKRLMDLWLYEIAELKKSLGMINKYDPDTGVSNDSLEFAGYDKDVLETFLTNPEDKAQFKKFHTFLQNEIRGKMEKINAKINAIKWGEHEVPGEVDAVRRGFQSFLDKRPELKAQQYNKFANPENEETLEDSFGVMGYMTEQISKDRFKPKGEFKDRGCRKLSYHEWILKYR